MPAERLLERFIAAHGARNVAACAISHLQAWAQTARRTGKAVDRERALANEVERFWHARLLAFDARATRRQLRDATSLIYLAAMTAQQDEQDKPHLAKLRGTNDET